MKELWPILILVLVVLQPNADSHKLTYQELIYDSTTVEDASYHTPASCTHTSNKYSYYGVQNVKETQYIGPRDTSNLEKPVHIIVGTVTLWAESMYRGECLLTRKRTEIMSRLPT